MAISIDVNRPRNVDWKRAAAFLYGDWGTSKAYVLGLAFVAAGYASLPLIVAVCAITGLVGINYLVICRHFPDGGGVYSAARAQGRTLAVIGALLLVADLTVTAALSGWSGLDYFPVPFLKEHITIATIGVLLVMGWLNWYGPKHSGGLAVGLSVPVMVLVAVLLAVSIPHLTTVNLQPLHKTESLSEIWIKFVETILALSGVEAIANMTGVLKLDPDSTPEHPKVGRESAKAIWAVSVEVVIGTALLGWAMLSIPPEKADLPNRSADVLRVIGEYFGHLSAAQWFHNEAFAVGFGHFLGITTGILFFLLLLSAANTAMVAMIGVFYMMARDGEMPRQLGKLNRHGVPIIPLAVAVGLPAFILIVVTDFNSLAGLYAIGVVGAITLNLGSCTFNRALDLKTWERALFAFTFVVLFLVEMTLAKEKHDALFFVMCILLVGLGLRSYAQKRQGLVSITLTHDVAELVKPETIERLRPRLLEGQRIMVAARGVTPVLRFALDEAVLRKAQLLVLYVKEVAVFIPAGSEKAQTRARWQDDQHAAAIMSLVLKLGAENNVEVLPVYAVSTDPVSTILDLTATLGVDYLFLGAPHRFGLAKLLKGDVVGQVAAGLPEDIQLLIHG